MRRRLALLGFAMLVAVAALTLSACSAGQRAGTSSGTSEDTTGFAPGSGKSSAVQEGRAVGYFVTGEKLTPVRVDARADDPEGALTALFAGPTPEAKDASCTTAIPASANVLGVQVDGDTATADVSPEFGSGGGSLSMQLRVAQVVFTLTRDPAVKKVILTMGGKPIHALGGEGLSLSTPQTRAAWERFSPEVLVESPVLGDIVASPLEVKGTARVPATKIKLAMTGADGFQVTSAATTLTAEVGTRGDFEQTLQFELPAGEGFVIASYAAPDRSRVESMRVPVNVK